MNIIKHIQIVIKAASLGYDLDKDDVALEIRSTIKPRWLYKLCKLLKGEIHTTVAMGKMIDGKFTQKKES